MTIKEVCTQFDISADTLRYYEKAGALPPVTRTVGKQRDYTEEDLKWVRLAKCLRSAGVSIEAVAKYVDLFQQGPATHDERLSLLNEQLDMLLAARKKYDDAIETLKTKIEKYENGTIQ